MAPRTRSNRAEKLANERLLARGIILNSHGLTAIPMELYSEILSHLRSPLSQEPDPYMHVTLLALSQTCRVLRAFFLRYAWERIEVFGGMWTPTGRLATYREQHHRRGVGTQRILDMKFVKEIVRQFETVTLRNPELGQHVRIVNIMFVYLYHKDDVLSELAHALSLLPRVHTLQITSPYSITMDFFSEYTYPNIHTLCLPYFIQTDIFQACPNMKSLRSRGRLALLGITSRSQIETLGVVSVGFHELSLEEIARDFSRLRSIDIDISLLETQEDRILCLSSLPLHTVQICLYPYGPYPPSVSVSGVQLKRWTELAKKMLKMCPTQDAVQKRVVVFYKKDEAVIHPVSS